MKRPTYRQLVRGIDPIPPEVESASDIAACQASRRARRAVEALLAELGDAPKGKDGRRARRRLLSLSRSVRVMADNVTGAFYVPENSPRTAVRL